MKIFLRTIVVILFVLSLISFYNYKFDYNSLEILLIGMFITYLWYVPYRREISKKIKEYQNRLEKTSVSAETDSSKVEVLEAKIQSLEKALQSALEKNKD
ncbi:MAG TPA: hypothetical protein PKI94_03235 [Candidatus Gastranaerophilaceae bacterium]|nr:hypothetical protein [Candidatus Gastranaerophilaceae bacterium]